MQYSFFPPYDHPISQEIREGWGGFIYEDHVQNEIMDWMHVRWEGADYVLYIIDEDGAGGQAGFFWDKANEDALQRYTWWMLKNG